MEKKTKIKKIEKKTKIKQIQNTPFIYQEHNGEIFITCGKIKLKVDKDISNIKDWEEWEINNKWETISLLCQAICYEIINKNNYNK